MLVAFVCGSLFSISVKRGYRRNTCRRLPNHLLFFSPVMRICPINLLLENSNDFKHRVKNKFSKFNWDYFKELEICAIWKKYIFTKIIITILCLVQTYILSQTVHTSEWLNIYVNSRTNKKNNYLDGMKKLRPRMKFY